MESHSVCGLCSCQRGRVPSLDMQNRDSREEAPAKRPFGCGHASGVVGAAGCWCVSILWCARWKSWNSTAFRSTRRRRSPYSTPAASRPTPSTHPTTMPTMAPTWGGTQPSERGGGFCSLQRRGRFEIGFKVDGEHKYATFQIVLIWWKSLRLFRLQMLRPRTSKADLKAAYHSHCTVNVHQHPTSVRVNQSKRAATVRDVSSQGQLDADAVTSQPFVSLAR